MRERDVLPRARDVDVEAATKTFFATKETWQFENTSDMMKTLCGRTVDAIAPVILSMARSLRDGGPVTAPDGTTARHVPFESAWQLGVAVERPGEPGYLFSVDLDVPATASAATRNLLAMKAMASRLKHSEAGLSGEDLDRAVDDDGILDEILVEEEMEKRGYPADLPPADGVDKVRKVRLTRYGRPAPAPVPGEDFASYVAALRLSGTGNGLAATVADLSRGKYVLNGLFEASPSYSFSEEGEPATWSAGHMNTGLLSEWPVPFAMFSAAAAASGHSGALEARVAEVAARVYEHNNVDPEGTALDELGQALACMDTGMPGVNAIAYCTRFQGLVSASVLAQRLDDIASFVDALRANGHDGPGNEFVHNDLDNAAYVERHGEREVVGLRDQNGTFLAVVGRDASGAVSTLAAARFGLPLEDYLEDNQGPWEKLYIGDDFLRDHANPRDPAAPLPREEALAALLAGKTGFPGFVGSFLATPGGLATSASGPYSRRTLADVNLLTCVLESGRIEIEEDRSPAP